MHVYRLFRHTIHSSYIDEEHRKQTQTKFSTKTDVTMINMQKYNTKTEQKREKSKRKQQSTNTS